MWELKDSKGELVGECENLKKWIRTKAENCAEDDSSDPFCSLPDVDQIFFYNSSLDRTYEFSQTLVNKVSEMLRNEYDAIIEELRSPYDRTY